MPSSSVLLEPDGKLIQETNLHMEKSVLLPEEHGQVYVSNPTPKTLSKAVVGRLEMVKESKANTTLLELKSDPNRENSPS